MFLLPGHTTDTENQPSKSAREEKSAREIDGEIEVYGVWIKREGRGVGLFGVVSGEQFNSLSPVFIFLSTCCTAVTPGRG